MRPQLLIWDWNGTILDDTFLTYEIANRMLRERGLPALDGQDAYRDVFGFPIREYYLRMGYTFEKEPYETVADEFVALYADGFPRCPLHRDVVRVIDTLAARGYPQALLSATRRDQLLEQVERHGIADRFVRILGLTNHFAHSKAELARAFIAEMRIPPEHALFIGDTDHDHAVASAIGCACVLIDGGHQSHARLAACGVPVLGCVTELLAYLE